MNSELRRQFSSDSRKVISQYGLSEEEAEALMSKDVKKLWNMGVNGVLLFYLFWVHEGVIFRPKQDQLKVVKAMW